MFNVMQGGSQIRRGEPESTMPLEMIEIPTRHHPDNGTAMEWRTAFPRPKWGLLYAVLPLIVVLFALADLVPATSGWRMIAELGAALVVIAAMAAWVRANRLALSLMGDGPEGEQTLRVRVIYCPRSISMSRLTFPGAKGGELPVNEPEYGERECPSYLLN